MTLTITVDSQAVQRKLKGASMALRKHVARKLRRTTGPAINKKFQQFAPKSSSRLANSGHIQVLPKHMKLNFTAGEGLVGYTTGFPYPLWVAGIIPTITARPPYFPDELSGKQVRYGMSGGVRWQSTARWWPGVQTFARRKVPQDVNQAIKSFVKEMNS